MLKATEYMQQNSTPSTLRISAVKRDIVLQTGKRDTMSRSSPLQSAKSVAAVPQPIRGIRRNTATINTYICICICIYIRAYDPSTVQKLYSKQRTINLGN